MISKITFTSTLYANLTLTGLQKLNNLSWCRYKSDKNILRLAVYEHGKIIQTQHIHRRKLLDYFPYKNKTDSKPLMVSYSVDFSS